MLVSCLLCLSLEKGSILYIYEASVWCDAVHGFRPSYASLFPLNHPLFNLLILRAQGTQGTAASVHDGEGGRFGF